MTQTLNPVNEVSVHAYSKSAHYENLPLFIYAFLDAVKQCPEKVAITFVKGRTLVETNYTYRDLDKLARCAAFRLGGNENTNKKIGIPAENNIDFVAGLLACFYIGAIAVPIPVNKQGVSQARGNYILEHANLDKLFVFGSESFLIEPSIDIELVKIDWNDNPAEFNNFNVQAQQDDIALIQFTSGTSGEPAGVCLSHKALVYNLKVIEEAMGHTLADNRIGMNWCPFYHDMGLIGGLLNPLYTRLRVIQMSPLDFLKRPQNWLVCIDKYRVTSSGGPPFSYQLLSRALCQSPNLVGQLDLSCWDVAFCGAEPVNPVIIRDFIRQAELCGFKSNAILPCYGMAEFGLFVSGSAFLSGMKTSTVIQKDTFYEVVSCGFAYGDTSIRVLDAFKRPQPEGQEGDIYITGSSLLSGYLVSDELTVDFESASGETKSYLPTGDIGFIQDGEIYITGRKKHCVKVNGVTLFPHLIISELATQFEILESLKGIIIQPDPNDTKLLIFQELVRGCKLAHTELKMLNSDIQSAAIHLTGSSKVDVYFLESGTLPKTTSGKVISDSSSVYIEKLKNLALL